MAYCRLEDTFRQDAKFRKLARALGIERAHARGIVAGLWSWAITHAPDGFLGDIEAEDLADAADWNGDPEALLEAMIQLELLDTDDVVSGYCIHAYAERAESFRRAAQRRDARARKNGGGAYRDLDPPVGGEDPPARVAPVDLSKPKVTAATAEILRVFAAWTERHPDEFVLPHGSLKEWRAIKARIEKDGITADQIIEAIAGIHKDPWPDRSRNLTLWNVVKDADAVHRFRRMAKPPAPKRFNQTPTRVEEPEPELTDEERAEQAEAAAAARRQMQEKL